MATSVLVAFWRKWGATMIKVQGTLSFYNRKKCWAGKCAPEKSKAASSIIQVFLHHLDGAGPRGDCALVVGSAVDATKTRLQGRPGGQPQLHRSNQYSC